ncbi:hypothetical protein JCM6292_3814 [Bacteroides pyogenes JCM 6292]|uniref:Uncharacterized protein n=2 Tax=Bacteroides pyogenes TaxID=310300 RepID=W4PKG5_9BACE|nr:hypothetical protein JCM6292_3814 [Bacteroides pyogenes JCM 6292]GAE20316.1 hypothetical protein JCM6294_3490 [Bacteroides pyogenes DSM 20611 = JCM 6294]
MLQHRIIKFEKTFYTEFVGKGLPYVVVCGLLVDADYPISAALRWRRPPSLGAVVA